MTRKIVNQRIRYFLAAEGESEQSFVKWLQHLANEQELHIHLDCQPLGGGGHEIMLNRAIRYAKRKDRSNTKSSILLIDADRTANDDNWSLETLRINCGTDRIYKISSTLFWHHNSL